MESQEIYRKYFLSATIKPKSMRDNNNKPWLFLSGPPALLVLKLLSNGN